MIRLPDKETTLAVRLDGRLAIFRRMFETQNATWRYRCVSAAEAPGASLVHYTPFAEQRPKAVDRAIALLERVETEVPGLLFHSLDACARSEGAGRGPAASELSRTLLYYADFYRFFQVNSLIARSYFAHDPLPPLDFTKILPVLWAIVMLDLRPEAEAARTRLLPAMIDRASTPGFRDDGWGQGAGSLRAVAELSRRSGHLEAEYRALSLSHRLSPREGKRDRLKDLRQMPALAGVA